MGREDEKGLLWELMWELVVGKGRDEVLGVVEAKGWVYDTGGGKRGGAAIGGDSTTE